MSAPGDTRAAYLRVVASVPGLHDPIRMIDVLFLAANPDLSRLRLDEEHRQIAEVFRLGTLRDRFRLHARTDVRWRDLRQAILEIRPTILHFSGHGERGRLVLSDDADGAREVPLTALQHLLAAPGLGVRVLMLNACSTAEHAGLFGDVVEHVIAMRGLVSDRGASLFAEGFYGALVCGHKIATAFAVGTADVAAGSPDPDDVARLVHQFKPGAAQDLAATAALAAVDPMIASLAAITTDRNVYPLLPRGLVDQLAETFPQVRDVIEIVTEADALVHQASDLIRSDYRGYSLTIARVPLEAGSRHAWSAAIRDSAALSPYAIMAILLVARGMRPTLTMAAESIAIISKTT